MTKFKSNLNIHFLILSFLGTAVAVGRLLNTGPNNTEELSKYLLIAFLLLVVFNYNFVSIVVKYNNEIKESFRWSINDSLLQIKKIKLDNNIISKVGFIKSSQNFSVKPINFGFIPLSMVGLFPLIGLLGVINNGYSFVVFALVLLFIYVTVLILFFQGQENKVKEITENRIDVIRRELKKLRSELPVQK
jgi:hypothetical protein